MLSANEIFIGTRFRIVWHVAFWMIVLIYYTLFFGHQGEYYWPTFRFVVFMLPIAMGTTYLFNYYLIPKFLFRKRIGVFILLSIYAFIASFLLISLLIFPFLITSKSNVNFVTLDKSLLDVYFLIVGIYTAILIAILIKLLKYSYERQHLNLRLLKEKTAAELEMLRSQINPHFLFNTLNSIYTLSLKKSELTPQVVLKLSEMLDYLLYECDASKVSLKKEITLIENYIYLQQVRFGNRVDITFLKEIEHGDLQIAPMLLLPFVENSFKHGIGKNRRKVKIHIELNGYRDDIFFSVKNDRYIKSAQGHNASGGIGIANVRKRLNLIYPDSHKLKIEDGEGVYYIKLKLNRTS